MSSDDPDEEDSPGRRALDFVFDRGNLNNNNNNGNKEGHTTNTGFFSLPGLGAFDFDENNDKYFPFRNHIEDSRDPRQVAITVMQINGGKY